MKIFQGLIILFLPIVIILSNLLILTNNFNFYKTIYNKENIYQHFQSKAEVNNSTKELIGYFRGQNNLENNIYSYQAKVHLKDVKSLLQTVFFINYLSIFFMLFTAIYLIKNKKIKLIKKSIIIGSIILIFIVIIIALSLALNFDFIFIKFHKLIFRNNLWLFPESDNLIKLFPQEFFIAFANQLFINILLTAFALIGTVMLFINNDKLTN